MPEPISREKLDIVIERIAFEKMSVATACDGICAPSAFFRYLTEDAALEEQYTRARATRADARFESIDGVMGALLKGQIDHATARVMVDTIKWQCGREKPKRYADKVDHRFVDEDGKDRPFALADVDSLIEAADKERS